MTMDDKIFENLLIADFYIRYQERKNRFRISDIDKLFKKIKKEVCAIEEMLLVDDKDIKSENLKSKVKDLFAVKNELTDTDFYSLLNNDADWEQIIRFLAQIIKQDGIVSSKEKEIITSVH